MRESRRGRRVLALARFLLLMTTHDYEEAAVRRALVEHRLERELGVFEPDRSRAHRGGRGRLRWEPGRGAGGFC